MVNMTKRGTMRRRDGLSVQIVIEITGIVMMDTEHLEVVRTVVLILAAMTATDDLQTTVQKGREIAEVENGFGQGVRVRNGIEVGVGREIEDDLEVEAKRESVHVARRGVLGVVEVEIDLDTEVIPTAEAGVLRITLVFRV